MLAAIVAVSALLASGQYLGQKPIYWRTNSELKYVEPEVPPEFDDNGRGAPIVHDGGGWGRMTYSYKSGREMYLMHHADCWQFCREQFYSSTPCEWHSRNWFDRLSVSDLDSDNWTYAHVISAKRDGYSECRASLDQMLKKKSSTEIKNAIGYHRGWILLPLWTLSGVSGWLTWYLRRRENDAETSGENLLHG